MTMQRALWSSYILGECLREAEGDTFAGLQAAHYILATQPVPDEFALSADAGGREHAPAGSPKGGQFVSGSSGGGKSAPKSRSESLVDKLTSAREAYQKSREAYQKAREEHTQAYKKVKQKSEKQLKLLQNMAKRIRSDGIDYVMWDSDSEEHEYFATIETLLADMEDNESVADIRSQLTDLEDAVASAKKVNETLADTATYEDTTKEEWAEAQKPNAEKLDFIERNVKNYKKEFRKYIRFRKDMRAMREGMSLSIEFDGVLLSTDNQGHQWVTIGGREKDGKRHAGGNPVLLDDSGNIIGGRVPKEWHGKHVSKVYKAGMVSLSEDFEEKHPRGDDGEFVEKGKSTGKKSDDKKKFGKSKAKVKIESVEGGINTQGLVKKILGGSEEDIASVIGSPDDAEVIVSSKRIDGKEVLHITVKHQDFEMERTIGIDKKGKKFIKNENFFMKPDSQSKGIGKTVFGRQIENAREMGIDYIKCHAAKVNPENPDKPHNGYYTWARFGYNMDFDMRAGYLSGGDRRKAEMASDKFGADSVLDVMETKEGQEWWKANGFDLTDARFDLSPNSRSLKVWEMYLEEKEKVKSAT